MKRPRQCSSLDLVIGAAVFLTLLLQASSSVAAPYNWTDGNLTPTGSSEKVQVKAVHITELQANINNRLVGCSYLPFTFTPVTTGSPITAPAVNELRAAVRGLYAGDLAALATYPSIGADADVNSLISSDHIAELRAAVDRVNIIGCVPSCPNTICGPGESCGTCPADCGACPAACNNGIVEPGEGCDAGGDTAACVGCACQWFYGGSLNGEGQPYCTDRGYTGWAVFWYTMWSAGCTGDAACVEPGNPPPSGGGGQTCGDGTCLWTPAENCSNCGDCTCTAGNVCSGGNCVPSGGGGGSLKCSDPGGPTCGPLTVCDKDDPFADGQGCVCRSCGCLDNNYGDVSMCCPGGCATGDFERASLDCSGHCCATGCFSGGGPPDPCATPSCGNGCPDPGENCSTCPADVGCGAFEYCSGGGCYCDATAFCQDFGFGGYCAGSGNWAFQTSGYGACNGLSLECC